MECGTGDRKVPFATFSLATIFVVLQTTIDRGFMVHWSLLRVKIIMQGYCLTEKYIGGLLSLTQFA